MKKIISIAFGTLLLASCSEDMTPDHPAAGKNIDLSIESSIILTRTSTSEEGNTIKTTFVADDNIGVYASGGASAANVKYTVASDGSKLSSDTPIAFTTSDNATLHAYSPYAEGVAASGFTFSIKADQTTAENFNASNFMTSAADVTKANPSANLAFTPRMALVYVEMAGSLGTTASGLTLCGMKPDIEWTVATDAVATSGTNVDVAMHKMGDTPKFMAFVPAQTSTDGTALFSITIGEKRYTYTPSTGIEFKTNTVKRFKLTVNDDNTVNIESNVVNGTDWTADGDQTEIESGEIIRDRVELISAEEGNFIGKTLASATGLQGVTASSWTAVIANDAATITIDGDAAVITTQSDSWYRRALVYRTSDGKGTQGKYTLKFDVKGGTDIQVAVMRGQIAGMNPANQYYAVAGTTAAKTEKTTNDYETKNLEIDLSTNSTADGNFSTGISVAFFAKDATANQTHYIKNVSLIEAE